jgi:3-oxoacyl-[acyl-carrier protein] reductase
VLVTGAAGTIGAAVAAAVEARGGEAVRSDLPETDVTRDEDVERLVREAGAVDACVNAFGAEGRLGPLEELDLDAARQLFELNVLAVLRVMKALVPGMRRRGGGRIVNLASGAGLAGADLMSAYSASKHAVVGLTRTAARELAAASIAVNAVCPGCVESPMMARVEAVTGPAQVPAGRYATPAEIGEVAAWLALEAPPYLTGAAIVVDGAMRA